MSENKENLKNDENLEVDEIAKDDESFDNKEELSEVEKLQNELSEITDKFYRANADFENIKKRLEKEKISAVAYAGEKFAKDFLPIIDAMEEALKLDYGENELAHKINEGIKHCVDMTRRAFEKHGIVEISNDGKFDPEVHNVISVIESSEHEKDEIVQVYQKGYKYKDRVLRASMVVVAK
ncbi:DnaK system nucleotide exchange factor GrpE [Campylobacter blaseri]|uniref:Protein GrpE n=1 Tax=Campylobacter blaseri TaxID=2042961 RepID=A0A2P8R252_9BACT|nr:nucleotide exchange factor GrpE [Campylobacter blaseri]PSM52558.1 nucleotide exchange factor GrpE [Campylobacter blaseri]PSM54206.1 nucleotide exchange factor GrpE [Campylobacter blaseri]QKF85857.1 DnaK system nucleotide exchange factor GrpE [Campylobacter blaseri]